MGKQFSWNLAFLLVAANVIEEQIYFDYYILKQESSWGKSM